MTLYGPNPEGILIFTPDGRYSLQIMRVNRPHYASPTAAGRRAEQGGADRDVSHFGTYTSTKRDKALTMHIEGSSYPNWDGTKQTRISPPSPTRC